MLSLLDMWVNSTSGAIKLIDTPSSTTSTPVESIVRLRGVRPLAVRGPENTLPKVSTNPLADMMPRGDRRIETRVKART